MLTAEAIRAAQPGPLGRNLAVVPTTASTNDEVLASARQGDPEGRVLFADEQTEGRGRLGRSWHSPRGLNLYFSVLLHPPQLSVARFPPLALVAGLAVAEAIQEVTGLEALVKWPNDVLLGKEKVAGVLTEALDGEPPALVVGVGLNVNQQVFPPELEGIATSLFRQAGHAFDRAQLAAALLRRLNLRLHEALAGHLQEVLTDWVAQSSTIGQWVHCSDQVEGQATGVADSGALLVSDAVGQVHQVIAGPIEEIQDVGLKV